MILSFASCAWFSRPPRRAARSSSAPPVSLSTSWPRISTNGCEKGSARRITCGD